MYINSEINSKYNIGFISTRFSGTDGVSLETTKWAEVLEELGHRCFYLAGKCDRPEEISMVEPRLFYRHPEILERHSRLWGTTKRSFSDTNWIHSERHFCHKTIKNFINKFNIDLLIAENCLTIPLHIPLALALTEITAETSIPLIAHHHDFVWERKRFLRNAIGDFINMAFPPNLESIQHVVINSIARKSLANRCGISSTLIPNVMNYEVEAPPTDSYPLDIRERLGISEEDLFILQPTRIVQRKGIEHAVELVHRLKRKAHLVISHASGDEGDSYSKRIIDYAKILDVSLIFASHLIREKRGLDSDGNKLYSLLDIYSVCDLVSYPSSYEGFGNAFLEGIAYHKPIVVQNYSVYATDIRPKGFKMIEFDEYVAPETIEQVKKVLEDKELREKMCKTNIQLAKKFFSYPTLRYKLKTLVANAFGVNGSF